jgi:16S rRNA (guanine527-N7)-methyltransferase
VTEAPEALEIRRRLGVSRETTDRLADLVALLLNWNRKINLIGRGTEPEVWHRHVLDSAQLWPLRPAMARTWVDLGSGAGFPGLVIAILAKELDPSLDVILVESDQRKAAFLATAVRELDLNATVHADRVEACAPFGAGLFRPGRSRRLSGFWR